MSFIKTMLSFIILGTRETSYLSAIASASAALAIAKACSKGQLRECSCGPRKYMYKDSTVSEKDLFPWRGCQNHIQYGLSYSKEFLDPMNERRKQRSIKKLVAKQNNVAGRQVCWLVRTIKGIKCTTILYFAIFNTCISSENG